MRAKKPRPTPFDAEIAALEKKLKPLKQKARFYRNSMAQQEKLANPEYMRRFIESMRSPEAMKKRAAASRRRNADPAERQRKSERMKKLWQKPGMREKLLSARAQVAVSQRLNKALGVVPIAVTMERNQ